ncbi:DUF7504 family protein [Halorarum salinum]|uniref:DUF7344 domain-containing protein n=1 Tax=Halorarum salinum TaxID=2743089 RepID=A0A7D5QAD0_9EURY|nr:hypothetical protein [Halobaculum salinum]QLG62337.1 hypothetical protein HUG12_11595 [Halobaculum salinum]
MGANPSLLDRGDNALIAAAGNDAVGSLCTDLLIGGGQAVGVVAVTADRDPLAMVDCWRRRDRGRFHDASLVAIGSDVRSAAATVEGGPDPGLVRPVDDAVTIPELVSRVEEQLRDLDEGCDRHAVFVDAMVERYDATSYAELVDRLTGAVSACEAVGVFRLPPDETAFPALRPRFDVVVDVRSRESRPLGGSESPSAGELFEALGTRRRREVLRYLLAHRDEPTAIADLAWALADADGDGEAVRKRHVGLVHSDLPSLERLGFVTVGSDRAVVDPRDRIAAVEPFLTLVGANPT